ncbi:hypothetical protein L8C07_13355 [Paenibacillus sp. CMAA1739]|uniref:hypothetical protein n=1 Tax=Paenibacillus ottowii TaxID=2315729 RepID=UPI002730CC75|nr:MULTISPECIES: hypothetical protein [Paenibacillus]MDP1509605.1 hypothetical protein [Paenibacillus ottowii]MEC4566932.1 hypothetical protein [Paenibacillus sp. CMAA1739]
MSLSINRHLITTSYDNSNTVKSNENGLNNAGHTTHKKSNDSLELSTEFMEYAGGMQAPLPTGNCSYEYKYDQDTVALTVDEQKSLLSDLQSSLTSSSALTETDDINNSMKNPLATVSDLLTKVDLATATDEEVSDLFDKVAETIQNNRPAPPPEGDLFRPEVDNSGLPPMMQAMGGIMPPFAWNIQETTNQEDNTTISEKELTVDEKRSVLNDLQNVLSSDLISGSISSETDEQTDLISALKNAWGNTDESNATDEEISALFDKIAKIFEQSISSSS